MSIPSPTIVTSTDDRPWDTSGSGTPVIGTTPITAPMFTTAWMTIHEVIAAEQQPAERVGRAPRDPQPGERQPAVQRGDAERADQAEFLADDREDEVAGGLGQPAPLILARAEPHAEEAAGRRARTRPWMDC